jgi:hypothetical protein
MEKIKYLFRGMNPKQWLPYLAAVVIFTLMTLAYVNPVLVGKQLVQSDIIKWQGMSKEIVDYREVTGEEALWTNAMFGGMPAFQISVVYSNNISNFFHRVLTLWLPRPADMIFLYFLGFFIFLILLKVNPWIALAGAIGFAFSSYHFIILEAGHNSKAVAIAYMAPVIGSIIYTFRSRLLTGGILFALFMGLQLFANHFQITYYMGIIIVIYGLFELARHLKEKKINHFFRAVGVLLAGLVLAIGLNIGNFWSTYSYTSETMRGGSELTIGDEQTTSGLTKEYITNWSYGITESFSLIIPNVKGGGSGILGNNPRAMKHVSPGFETIISNENHYWGNQPITSGPVYVGVVVAFFFILALFYVKGPLKWALLLATILSVMLSWGKNFMPLTEFFIDYVPGYNKFRAVSMTLVIAEFCIPALAFIGLHKLYHKPELFSFKSDAFFTATGLTAGLSLIFYVSPDSFLNFLSRSEASVFRGFSEDPMMAGQVNMFITELESVRMAIFKADALRSMLFALAAAGLLWLYASKKLTRNAFAILLILLITVDMWPINRRYLNDEDFIPRRRAEVPFSLRQVDAIILEDSDLNYRVLDMTESTFNSSRTSYYHHSIGGYHGAKLRRYQDLIDHHITENMMEIGTTLRNAEELEELKETFAGMPVLNMLNTRYLIYHPERSPIINESALGNAWFVENFRFVDSADEEIMALKDDFDPLRTAIIDRRFSDHLSGKSFSYDPEAYVTLEHAQPNQLRYRYRASSEQLLVFSEVFYPEGWKVSINNQPAEHFRVNYILRAMVVPAGEQEILFSFEPKSYYTGEKISLAFSILLVLLMLSAVGFSVYKARGETDHS